MTGSTSVRTGAPRFKRLAATALMLMVGALIGVLIGQTSRADPGSLTLLLPGLVLSGLFQILIHEAGHVLAGLRSGLRLVMLAVGPLHYEPGRGIRWRRSPLLGFAYLMPPPGMPLPQIADSFRRMVVGGPAAGLLLSALCAGLALILPGGDLRAFLGISAVLGGLLNLLSVVPMAGGGILNDGARYRRLRPGAPHAQAEAALIALTGLARVQRPRDWPPELLLASQQPHGTPSFDAAARHLAAAQAIDTGDLERADTLQQQASELGEGFAPALRASFSAEEVYLKARRGQASEARAEFDRLPRSAFVPQVTRSRVEAAVLLAEGRPQEAHSALKRARLDLASPLASRGIEAAWLGELEAQLNVPV